LVDDAIPLLVGILVIVTVEHSAHARFDHDLVDRISPPGGSPGGPSPHSVIRRFVIPAPLDHVCVIGAGMAVVLLLAETRIREDLVSKDELVRGVAVLEGRLEPVELRLSQRPVPGVAGSRRIVFAAAQVRHIRFGRRVPEWIDHHEQCIAPRPGVIVLALAVARDSGLRGGIARIEPIRHRHGEVLLLCVDADHRQAVGQRALQMPAFPLLMVARHQEDRARLAETVEVRKLVLVRLLGFRSLAWIQAANRDRVAQVQVKVRGPAIQHIIADVCPRGFNAHDDVHVGIRRDRERKCAARGPRGPEGVLVPSRPRGSPILAVLHPVVVPGVGIQPTQHHGRGHVGRSRCVPSSRVGSP